MKWLGNLWAKRPWAKAVVADVPLRYNPIIAKSCPHKWELMGAGRQPRCTICGGWLMPSADNMTWEVSGWSDLRRQADIRRRAPLAVAKEQAVEEPSVATHYAVGADMANGGMGGDFTDESR